MTLRACYFWFTPWPQALALLGEHAPAAERVWTGPDDQGYWRQFARRWQQDGDLLVIEQDVGIHAGVIPEMEACPEPWCAFQSVIGGGLAARGLGCTRFSAGLRERVTVQDIMCPVPHLDASPCGGPYCAASSPGLSACHNRHRGCPDCGAFCHRHLDGPVCDALRLVAGLEEPHVHYPPVRHFHYELGRLPCRITPGPRRK